MEQIFESMRQWSETLKQGRFDEHQAEIEIQDGRSARTVINTSYTVQGKRGDTPVVVRWEAFFSPSVSLLDTALRKNVLDVFVGCPHLRCAGWLHQRTWFNRQLKRYLGMGKGLIPTEHPLFEQFMFQGAHNGELAEAAFCQDVAGLIERWSAWLLEFQKESGVSMYTTIQPKDMSVSVLDRAVDDIVALLPEKGEARSSSAPPSLYG